MIFFIYDLLFEKLESLPIANSYPNPFQALFEFFVVFLVVFFYEFLESLAGVLYSSLYEIVPVSFEGGSLNQDNIDKVSFLEVFESLKVGYLQDVDTSPSVIAETKIGYIFGSLWLVLLKFEYGKVMQLSEHISYKLLTGIG